MTSKNVAIFGGSFDPPHIAHIWIASKISMRSDINEVWIVPTFRHCFHKKSAPYEDRKTMTELAFSSVPNVKVCEIEKDLGNYSTTIRTLTALKEMYPSFQFHLVMGADIIEQKDKWVEWKKIISNVPLIVIGRETYPIVKDTAFSMPNIRSSEIRHRIRKGKNISHLVPKTVRNYIKQTKLYQKDL